MSDTTRRFFSGDTLEQALMQAARHFGIDPEEVAYRQIEKKHGFVKMRRRFVIEVSPEAPRREGPPAAAPAEGPAKSPEEVVERPAPPVEAPPVEAPPAPPAPRAEIAAEVAEGVEAAPPSRTPGPPLRISERIDPETVGEGPPEGKREPGVVELPEAPRRAIDVYEPATGAQADAAREALRRLFALGRLELEAEVLQGEDRLEIEIWGADQEELLRDRGRALLGIQHLLPRLIRGVTGESSPCRVDCENFHEIRAERLRDLAQRAASEVARRGRPRTLEPMSPDERRIVHLTLADDPTVVTESKGEGLFKRVMVLPAGSRKPRGFDPYGR